MKIYKKNVREMIPILNFKYRMNFFFLFANFFNSVIFKEQLIFYQVLRQLAYLFLIKKNLMKHYISAYCLFKI